MHRNIKNQVFALRDELQQYPSIWKDIQRPLADPCRAMIKVRSYAA